VLRRTVGRLLDPEDLRDAVRAGPSGPLMCAAVLPVTKLAPPFGEVLVARAAVQLAFGEAITGAGGGGDSGAGGLGSDPIRATRLAMQMEAD
jgi:hypothetical protein